MGSFNLQRLSSFPLLSYNYSLSCFSYNFKWQAVLTNSKHFGFPVGYMLRIKNSLDSYLKDSFLPPTQLTESHRSTT
jgi:hypothetical protein